MNKIQMIEEIIGERPNELMLDALWEDQVIINRMRAKLQGISEKNLQPYHDHFVGYSRKKYKIIEKHIPIYPNANKVIEYIKNLHGAI